MAFAKKITLGVGLAVVILLTASPVFAVENSGVGGKPANPRPDNPRSESIFVYELAPGQSVKDGVRVVNSTDQPKQVAIYATDSIVSSGGSFACEQKADELNSEGKWIKLDKETVNLGPQSEETVNFVLNVPKDTSVGEHNACIAIQAIEAPVNSDVNGVQLSFRSAIRVAITVPGDLSKTLNYESLTAEVKKDIIRTKQVLYNSGNVSLDTDINTKLKTVFGITLQTIDGEYPVLAQQRAEFNYEFKRPMWGGFYILYSNASYNSDKNSTLGEKSENRSSVDKSKLIFVWPTALAWLVYVVLLVILGLIGYIFVYQNIKVKRLKKSAAKYKVKDGEDIQGLAKNSNVSWKLIAKMNSLKAPYILEPGNEILIPSKTAKQPISEKKSKPHKEASGEKPKTVKKTKKTNGVSKAKKSK